MNEEALKDAYSLFTNTGYNGTQDEFYTLLSDNAEAFADSYGLFKDSGYNGSEDDYKELLGLKKKDASVLQDLPFQMDTKVSASESQEPTSSLDQRIDDSLNKRLASIQPLQDGETDPRMEASSFFEEEGLYLKKYLSLIDRKFDIEKELKSIESSDEKPTVNPFAKTESSFINTLNKGDQALLKQELSQLNAELDPMVDSADKAKRKYDNAKFYQLQSTVEPSDLAQAVIDAGIDQGNIKIPNLVVGEEIFSLNEYNEWLYKRENVNAIQEDPNLIPEQTIEFLKNSNNKALNAAYDLTKRQILSGGEWGDKIESLESGIIGIGAGAVEMIAKGSYAALDALSYVPKTERLEVGLDDPETTYSSDFLEKGGSPLANRLKEKQDELRANIRAYDESSITESLLKGNILDAVNQGGNALMESAPLTASLMLAGPLGVSQTATLFGAGIVSAGQNELELLSQREEGRDIADWQINLSNLGSFAGEYIGERYTLGLINDARRLSGLDPTKEADAIVDSFVKGVTKGFGIEAASEGFTETINYLTDSAVGLEDFDLTKFGIRIADASIIGGFSGAGIHTSIRTGKAVSRAITNLEIIDENTTVIFKYADNKTEELSRTDAIKLVRKDPELRQQIRDGVVKADYSMNEVARKAIEDLVYGYYAPDAETNRAEMREKEKVVQNLSDAVKEDPSLENINKLSNAISEMEAEAKVSEYNESKSTEATRAKTKNIFNEKGVEIIDAMKSQDVSQSKVTETTEVDKIENKDQYESAKKQIKNNKVPKLVTSQTQTGVKVEGELLQTSEVTQGKFKSMNAAKNAIKDYEAKIKAQEQGQMLEEELSPLNNKLFIETNKEALDEVPKEVLDSKDYYILTSEKEGLNRQERKSRMSELTSILDDIGATYYKVKGVYNGVAEESLIVTGISEADALNAGRDFGQESIFSAKKGLMFSDGRVVPLNDSDLKGPKARSKDALTIMNVGGRKMSLHTGLDWSNTSYGKNFNSENVHRLNEDDPNYDKELLEGVTQDRKRVLGFVLKFLNSIGGLNVTVIRNSEAMQSQIKSIQKDRYIKNGMSEEKAEVEANKYASERRGGSFFLDKTIYVNLETVRGNTLFHEIIHPMVDFIKKTDPALYKRIEAEVAEGKVKRRTTKGGRKIKGSYLEWAQNNPAYASLSREEQIEEAFAEMMGDAAYGHFKNKGTRLNRLREVIKAILTKLGVTSLPENVEAIDLDDMSLSDIRTNLAEALVDGRKVNVGGVEFEVGETDAESRFQLDAIDRRTQVQYTYDVNSKEFADMEADGLITSGMTIQDFAGKTMMIHSPDATFSGSIIDKDGTILVEGKGGIYYTFKHNEEGYFWASTDNAANSMAKQLNSMLEANGGKIYMGLTTAREGKLLSNTAMSRGVVNLFTSPNFISKIGLSKPTLYKALIDAANQTSPLGDGLKLGLKPYRASSKFEGDVLEKVWDKLDNKKTSFKDRKFFTDKFLTLAKQSLESGSSKTNFVNFIKTTMGDESLVKFNNKGEPNVKSMKKALVNVLTEPELRGEEVTDKVYAVLEIDGPVKAIKTDEYESYGTAIVSESGNRAKIHRLDNREFWYDVAEDPMTNTVIGETTGRSGSGQISSRRSQIMPSMAGVSTTPLKISEKIRMQAPTYEMEYTPNSLVSLAMLSDNNRQPEQWVKEIGKGLKGASKDVDTMGLLDILKAYKKDAKVKSIPKEVVAQLIATNMADIETKILGGDIDYDNYDIDYDGDNYSITTPDGVTLRSDMEIVKDIEDLTTEEANSIIEETLKAENLGPVYSEVTLPGGENYREFLIKDKSPEEIFTAPHYDALGENLIASARVDDRVGPNGEKILFVQEIQSDWVQGTNKGNFKTKDEVEELESKLKALRLENINFLAEKANPERSKKGREYTIYIRKELIKMYPDGQGAPLLNKFKEEIEGLSNQLRNLKPYLPWNQTDLWVGLTIRKLINQASKEGYDQIAFVNGEQSDIIQGHSDGRTAEFYNKIVPKNINNELKRLVKGMKYGFGKIKPKPRDGDTFYNQPFEERIPGKFAYKGIDQVVINLTPELKAATDKVGPLRFQVPEIKIPETRYNDPKEIERIGFETGGIAHIPTDFMLNFLHVGEKRIKQYAGEEIDLEIKELREFLKKSPNLKDIQYLPNRLEATRMIANSIKKDGFTGEENNIQKGPILLEIDSRGFARIGQGNHRLLAAKALGMDKVPVTVQFSEFYDNTPRVNKVKVISDSKREELESIAKKRNYHTKYASIWLTDLVKDNFIENNPIDLNKNLEGGYSLNQILNKFKDEGIGLRFQAPQEEGESNVYTDGLVSIGWDISKAMQDLNYMSGTYLTGFIDQDSFRPKKRKRYDIKLTTLLAKPFGTHSDKEVKEIIVRSRGALNSIIIEANEVGKRLKKLNEKYNYTEQELNDFLHDHNKIKALEDSDIKNTLIEMRMSIDDLSKTLVAEDLIAGQTMFTVDSNLGLYVTKAYKNFEVKGWEQTDNLIIQKLKEFLRREAKKDNPEATEERLNQIVDVSYEELNSDKEFAYNVKNGGSLDGLSRLTSIFKQRKEIPQEIRDFWGEIDDPIFNYNNTIKKIAQTITAERMYKELYEIGNGKFISDTKTLDTFNELVGAKWGSIEGKFVDNEMFAVMNQIAPEKGTGTFNWIFDKYMELVLLNKKTKTVWNIGTHFKNIIGNTAFATMNGHIGFRGGMYQDAKASLKAVASSSDAELNAIRKNLIEKGVLSSSASLEEIRNISKDLGDTDYDLSKYLDEKNGKIQKLMSKAVRYAGKPLKYFDDKATRAYQAEDDIWKFYGFLSEKARYIEAGLSEKEADDMAARNIINLYPNYNEIPRIIRYIGRSPIVGSFVAFQSESFRNAKNAVKLGFEEMGSSNPKIKRIGTTRIAGVIATMTLLEGLQLYTMQFLSQALGLAGGDEEESEERRLRTMVAEWDRDGSLAYVDSGVLDSKTNENQMENDKYFDYINFSSISGVGHIRDILRLSFTDIDTEVGKESAYSIVKKMFEPFLGEEMTLATFLEAYENKGDRIYSRTDDAGTATLKMIEYVGKKVAMPGVGRNFIRIKESFEQDSERVPTYETLALFGLRISRTNLNKTLSINARNAYNDMRSRSSDKIIRDKTLLLNEIKNNPDLDNDLNIIADLMAGCRLNKVAGRDTKAILKGMGISDVVIDLAYNRMLKNYKQDVLSVDAK